MPVYLITYDLNEPGKDYVGVANKIASVCSKNCRVLKNAWFAYHKDFSAKELFANLTNGKEFDANDKLFVVEITTNNHNGWLSKSAITWLAEAFKQH